MIKYHEYRTGEQDYGEDHMLTNNWNPEQDYGKEYAKVYFNMETEGYDYPSFSFTEEQREKFTDDINRIFSSIGWSCEESEKKYQAYVLHGQKENLIYICIHSSLVKKC